MSDEETDAAERNEPATLADPMRSTEALAPGRLERTLRQLDDLATDMLALMMPEAFDSQNSSDEPPVQRLGLQRLVTSIHHLRSALRVKSGKLWPVFETIDFGLQSAIIESIKAILRSPIWPANEAFDLAYRIERTIVDTLTSLIDTSNISVQNIAEKLLPASRSAMDAVEMERHLSNQRERIDAIVSDVQTAAGSVADSELSSAFNTYQGSEASTANSFRIAALIVLLGVLGFSIYTAIEVPTSLGSSFAHLGIAFSGLAAFAYLARESAQHRTVARWAAIMSVQLKTLGAFTADMNLEQREELRTQFGHRVFSELPVAGEVKSQIEQLTPAMQTLLDVVKTIRGGS